MDAYRGSTVLAEPAPLRHEAQAQAHVQPALLELRGIAHNFRGLKVLEGVDEQLDYAISYLKKKIKDEPMAWPKQPPFPNKAATGYKK